MGLTKIFVLAGLAWFLMTLYVTINAFSHVQQGQKALHVNICSKDYPGSLVVNSSEVTGNGFLDGAACDTGKGVVLVADKIKQKECTTRDGLGKLLLYPANPVIDAECPNGKLDILGG